jgi:hypothetical protein
MPAYVIAVDVLGLVCAVIGFTLAFRQRFVRRLLGRPRHDARSGDGGEEGDPLTYVLRIAGVMVMTFGVAIAGMVTLFTMAQR